MAYTASKLLKIARGELGYKEKETNSQLDNPAANAGDGNWTKYARDLHSAGYYQAAKNGYAWCDMFVDWCFWQLAGKDKTKGEWLECQTGLYGAGCEWSSDCYRRAGRFDKNPCPGDQIFFGKTGAEDHTGIVEKIEGGKVHTIEGNASNMVKRCSYSLDSVRIVGYGHPRFDVETATEEGDRHGVGSAPNTGTPPVKTIVGANMTIRQKQWQLWYLGYYSGSIDGIWGNRSRDATVRFQRDNGLEDDGIFGVLTESETLKVIKSIQAALGIPTDGLAGEQTKAATMAYQKENGLIIDGIAGPKTRESIAQGDNWWKSIKYFRREEFKCKCGGRYCNGYPVEPKKVLVQTADRVRKYFGASAIVSSGVRCTKHNAVVGGVANSRHLHGKAMDFFITGKTAQQVLAYVQSLPDIRYAYAIDNSYVHMDIL